MESFHFKVSRCEKRTKLERELLYNVDDDDDDDDDNYDGNADCDYDQDYECWVN